MQYPSNLRIVRVMCSGMVGPDMVVRALDKTETLPRDTDGRVPPALIIGFRPKD